MLFNIIKQALIFYLLYILFKSVFKFFSTENKPGPKEEQASKKTSQKNDIIEAEFKVLHKKK